MRGLIVYAHTNEAGDILSYSGRDPAFADKWNEWVRVGRPEKARPMKHRYVKGYHIRRIRNPFSGALKGFVDGLNDECREAKSAPPA